MSLTYEPSSEPLYISQAVFEVAMVDTGSKASVRAAVAALPGKVPL